MTEREKELTETIENLLMIFGGDWTDEPVSMRFARVANKAIERAKKVLEKEETTIRIVNDASAVITTRPM